MILVRFVVNLLILAVEVGLVAAAAWCGWKYPLIFAGITTVLACLMGVVLERARLMNELPFYFGRSRTALSVFGTLVALGEGLTKAVLAGVVALLTFAGTNHDRLTWVAGIFAACVFFGSSLLRRLSMSFGAIPSRWGYFRLAAPLGLVYSAATSLLIPAASFAEVGSQLIFNLPARPTLENASEILFLLKQKFDDIVVAMLNQVVPPAAAKAIGVLISVNMLTGFVIGIFAVAIAEVVRRLEDHVP